MLLGENQKANLKRNMSKHNYSGVGSCAASLYQVSVLINGSQHIRPSPVCLCLFSMWCLLGWSCSLGCDLLIDAAVLYYEALVPHLGKRQNQLSEHPLKLIMFLSWLPSSDCIFLSRSGSPHLGCNLHTPSLCPKLASRMVRGPGVGGQSYIHNAFTHT